MIVFQTPTHPVILSNLGWCFFVENSVETFKDIAKVEHLWKKRETILENLLHNKLFDFCQGKKTSPFSLKDLCQIYFVQKTKRTFLKTSCCRLAYKKEKKNKAFIYKASTSMTKLCSFCLRQSLPEAKKKTGNTCLWKKKQRFFVCVAELFFLQNEESKKQTNEVRSFFFFLSRQQYCCATQGNIFLFHNCPKSTSLW